MKKWAIPPEIKVYEALGGIGDKRIDVSGDEAKVFSSSKGKFYSIQYNEKENAIMCNDNGSYWKGYLGYPSIAFLMLKGKIKYNPKFSEALKEIPWKDINVKFKNNFSKTEQYILEIVEKRGYKKEELIEEVKQISSQIESLSINQLGKRTIPPKGY